MHQIAVFSEEEKNRLHLVRTKFNFF